MSKRAILKQLILKGSNIFTKTINMFGMGGGYKVERYVLIDDVLEIVMAILSQEKSKSQKKSCKSE